MVVAAVLGWYVEEAWPGLLVWNSHKPGTLTKGCLCFVTGRAPLKFAIYADRKIRKQRKKLASAPGEWYRELPEQPKPHRGPEWPGTEMGPADAARLMLEAESYDRQRAYSSDRRGQGSPRQRPPPSGGRPRPEQRR